MMLSTNNITNKIHQNEEQPYRFMDDERDRPRSDRREGAYKMDRDYERGRGDYPPPPPRDSRGYDRDRMTSSRDYKPDKREHYDERRDHRMDTSPYPPDRRSMKRSREYDQREPKEPYGRDEREMYDRRERDRRRDEERSPTRKRGRYDEGPESLRVSSGSDDKKRAPYGSKTPLLFEGLMKSYKQFFEILGEHLPQHEAQKRYEEYKKEFNKRNSRTFFNEHCKEEWFKERYHPDWMKKRRETKIERAKAEAKVFAEELERGVLKYNLTADDFPHLLTKTSSDEGAPSHSSHHHDDEEEHSIGDGSLEVRDEGPEVTEEHAAQAGEEHSANNNNNEDSEGGKSKEGGGKQISIESSRPLDPRIDSSLDSYAAQHNAESSNTNKASGPQETKDKVIHFFPPRDPHTLFIKTIPPSCSREELLAVISKVEGGELRRLIIGQPNPYKYFHRVGWITYTTEEACDYALKTFNNYKFPDFALMLTTHIHRGGEQVRVTPAISSDPERLARDLKQLRQLAVQLDSEKGITENILVKRDDQDQDKDLALHQKVDRYNMYIRRVHAYCYYCSEEFFDPEDLFFRCGELHLRGTEKNHGDQDATAWYDNVDSKFRQRLETPDDPSTYGGQKMIERFKDEYATERTLRVEEGKYRCALCDKLFKGPEFVKKHIIAPVKADHVQIPEEVTLKAIDEQYYENYVSDPKRILPSNINFTKENEKQAQRNKKQNQQQQFDDDRQQQGYRNNNRGGGRGRGGFRGGRGRGGFNRGGYGGYNDGPQDKPMYESRKIMSYVDLDAPPDDSMELDYAKALKQFAEKQQQNK